MCGIFGIVDRKAENSGKIFRSLFKLSESRGKEAAGFALKRGNEMHVFKTPFPASHLIKQDVFKRNVLNADQEFFKPFIGIGHSRLVTNGYEQFDINNQPVIKNGMVVIHNGIVTNQSELWEKYTDQEKLSGLDSELIPAIISSEVAKGKDFSAAFRILFNEICGMTNMAMLTDHYNNLILATNNGSLYYANNPETGLFIFASENFILKRLLKMHRMVHRSNTVIQLKPGELASINLKSLSFCLLKIGEKIDNLEKQSEKQAIRVLQEEKMHKRVHINTSLDHTFKDVSPVFVREYEARKNQIESLKRCTKCILPETFPFIEFDDSGVCNYCNNYNKTNYLGKENLLKIADTFRKSGGEPECLIPFSGGRDSSFVLHYAVKELGLKPIAFSYDWGMITDLARRNQARMCGKLGVEHILISADIRKKRKNIQKNVLAWLKKPDLGTVPLFMAGDKQYFYYANQLMKQNHLSLSILGENHLETTNFKSGFCGITPKFVKGHTYSLSLADKIKMAFYYGKQYLINPAYLNSSLFDTLDAFRSYYIIKHNNHNIYDYIKWDESIITDVLLNKYDWETDPGTRTTWRIGDGTAAFYNYIYYMVAGFSENDTFRSNQIREGDMIRSEALKLSEAENKPRWDSLQWYCRTINVDFENAIRIINGTMKLF